MTYAFWENRTLKDAVDSGDIDTILKFCRIPGSLAACKRFISFEKVESILDTLLDYAFAAASVEVFSALLSGYSDSELSEEISFKAACALMAGTDLGDEKVLILNAVNKNYRNNRSFIKKELVEIILSGNAKSAALIIKLKIPELYEKAQLLAQAAGRDKNAPKN